MLLFYNGNLNTLQISYRKKLKATFSTLYTMLPHHLVKDKLIDLIDQTFSGENTFLAFNEELVLITSDVYKNYNLWYCQKVCDALVYLLENILLHSELNFIGKLLVFRWELFMLLLLQICFYFVMIEIS